nr:putative reverse transcriptase domain-containing protein [Tanacetum cinerariifolium]
MTTPRQEISSMEIEQIIAQRVTNAIKATSIYETRTRVAHDSMDQVAHQGAMVGKGVKNKRKWESGCDLKYSQQKTKQQKVSKAYAAGPNKKRGYAEKLLAPATGGDILQNVTYFGCCKQGHYKNRYPQLKNQNHGDQKGKVYLGNLPLCNKRKLHHLDQCPVKCRKCKRMGAELYPQHVSCVEPQECMAESYVQVSLEEIEIDENIHFVEEPIKIVYRDVKKLKWRRIPLVKVRLNSQQGAEYTWE